MGRYDFDGLATWMSKMDAGLKRSGSACSVTAGPYRVMMPKQTTDVDRLVGIRITALRKARGLSQTALGTAVGVTFQQVQKYEKGQNRVGAGRLREISKLLEVPVSAFFEESENGTQNDAFGFLGTQGAIELLRAYALIEDDQLRRDVLALVRTASKMGKQSAPAAPAAAPSPSQGPGEAA